MKVVTAEEHHGDAHDAEGQRKATGAGETTYFAGTVYEDRGTERIRYVHAGTACGAGEQRGGGRLLPTWTSWGA
ncbi:MAG: hypothetical protein IPI26_08950 [Elusimicrobia bacterium]|nr:hypothetical protein [Elusimicrobiota bacterium]